MQIHEDTKTYKIIKSIRPTTFMYIEQEHAKTETATATELCIQAQAWVQQQREEDIDRSTARKSTHIRE